MRIAPTLVPTTEQSPFASARKENEPGASTQAPHPFIQTGIFHEGRFLPPGPPRQGRCAGRAIQWNGGEIVRFYASGERSSVLVFMPKDMSESSALVLPLFFKL